MTQEQKYVPGTTRLGFSGTLSVLWPYFRAKFTEQVKGIWFIVFYLLFFQAVVLKLPVVFATMINAGFAIVVLGLMFFIEGLRLGLMPFGETIGAILPRNCKMSVILLFWFLDVFSGTGTISFTEKTQPEYLFRTLLPQCVSIMARLP